MVCNNIDYQFTKVPTKIYLCMDNNCRSMLFTLIQLSTMYADEQGWFFRTNADLEAETGLSKKVMDGTLDALLQKRLIDFVPQQQGKGVKQTSRWYMVNYNTFIEYETLSIEDCMKNPKYQIVTSDYKAGAFGWQGKEFAGVQASSSLSSPPTSTPTSSPTITPASTTTSSPAQPSASLDVPTSIDNIENTECINNIDIKFNNNLLLNNYLENSTTNLDVTEAVEYDDTGTENNYKHSNNYLSENHRNRVMDELLEYANSHHTQILNDTLNHFNEAANNILSQPSKKDFMMLCFKHVDTHGKMEVAARNNIYNAIKDQGIDNDYDFEQTFYDLSQYYIKFKNANKPLE